MMVYQFVSVEQWRIDCTFSILLSYLIRVWTQDCIWTVMLQRLSIIVSALIMNPSESDALKHNSTWGDNMPFPFSCHTARLCKNNISVFSLPPLLIDATRQLPAASTASDLPCEAWQIHFSYPQKQSLSCLEPLSQHVLPWQHHYPSLTSLYKSWRHIKSSIIRTRRLLRVTVPAFM